jgi:hypothetical protein
MPDSGYFLHRNAGAPSAGTSHVVTLTFGSGTTAGTFKLVFDGYTTADIAWSATNNTLIANIDAALGVLASINGAGNVTTAVGTMTSGIGTITVTFAGDLAVKSLGNITVGSQTTGGTLSTAITTQGVTATKRGAPKGAVLTDTTNGILYINTGTGVAPTWTKVGTQT